MAKELAQLKRNWVSFVSNRKRANNNAEKTDLCALRQRKSRASDTKDILFIICLLGVALVSVLTGLSFLESRALLKRADRSNISHSSKWHRL